MSRKRCLSPEECPCRIGPAANSNNSEFNEAHNNAIGVRAEWYVPEYRDAVPRAHQHARYCAANDDSDALGFALRSEIAKLEGVPVHNVVVGTSLQRGIQDIPKKTKRKWVGALEGDFPGYALGGGDGIPFERIPADLHGRVDPDAVARAVKDKPSPMLFLTHPRTNPGTSEVDEEVGEKALEANPDLLLFVDGAYSGFGGSRNLGERPLRNSRIIYGQTGSKDLFICGARVCWYVAQEPLLSALKAMVLRYEVSPTAIEHALQLLRKPAAIRECRRVQGDARDILRDGLGPLGFPLLSADEPWVLVKFGPIAEDVVRELELKHRIKVQPQAAPLQEWVRISATVPCLAEEIVNAMTATVTKLEKIRKIRELMADPATRDLIQFIVDQAIEVRQHADDVLWLNSVGLGIPERPAELAGQESCCA